MKGREGRNEGEEKKAREGRRRGKKLKGNRRNGGERKK